MTTPQQAFALRISEAAQYAELQVQRALGADWIDAYTASWRTMDDVYALVMAPERHIELGRLRNITGRGKS
jgi:hypothetical protein